MELIYSKEADYKRIYETRPAFFDEYLPRISNGIDVDGRPINVILFHMSTDKTRVKSSGWIFDKVSQAVLELSKELLEEVLLFQLSLHEENPVQLTLNKRNYLRSNVKERLDKSKQLLLFAKRLQRKGF